jgi:hypothetical protein
LRTTRKTKVRETCPRCGELIQEQTEERWTDANAKSIEDVSAVSAWLSGESKELHFTTQEVRDKEWQGRVIWALSGGLPAGCPENCGAEVVYEADSPRIVSVRLTNIEPGQINAKSTNVLSRVFRDHGLQPYGENISLSGIAGSELKSKWGPELYLNTYTLPPGLLRHVLARLSSAMRDATTMRERKQ